MKHAIPTLEEQESLKANFVYDNGKVYWRTRGRPCAMGYNKQYAGKQAGFQRGDPKRYGEIYLHQRRYYMHKVIYFLVHDVWEDMLDHIDRNPTNNLVSNLRPTDPSKNAINSKIPKNNTSGHKGVIFREDLKYRPWRATIRKDSKLIHIGYYSSKEEASKARIEKEIELFGQHSPHAERVNVPSRFGAAADCSSI